MIRILHSVRNLLVIFCVFGTSSLYASLIALDDETLSEIDGQAYINVESDTLSGSSHKYTRINFGLSAKVQVNIDTLKLGEYSRSGESNPADIDIDNFALGHIDGNNNIVPFEIEDPYIEIAYDADGRADGFRLGFKSANGSLSGDINALTGNIPVTIKGNAQPIRDSIANDLPTSTCGSGWTPFCDAAFAIEYAAAVTVNTTLLIGLSAIGINDGTIVESDGVLVNSSGAADAIRSTLVGIQNGDTLGVPGQPITDFLVGFLASNGCGILTIGTCFPLSQYETLQIGSDAVPAKGFFISLSRTNGLQWKDLDTGNALQVTSGAYLNVPKVNGAAAITVNFDEAFNGIARLNTCFGSIDRGC